VVARRMQLIAARARPLEPGAAGILPIAVAGPKIFVGDGGRRAW
jgi:hypothetical protein